MNKQISPFDVFSRMCDENNQAIKLSAMDNIRGARKIKAGTVVEIGVAGDVVSQIARGELLGGLILCDKKEFQRVKSQMEGEFAHGDSKSEGT